MKNCNDTSWDLFYLHVCYIVIVIYISIFFLSFLSDYCHHIYPTVTCHDWHSNRSIRLNICTCLQLGGIEPATFRFAANHLNHCATAVSRTAHYHTKSQLFFICLYLLPSARVGFQHNANASQKSYYHFTSTKHKQLRTVRSSALLRGW